MFYGRLPVLIPSSVTRRNLKGGRTVAENHTSGREAPVPRRAHRRYKSPALCYDPENAPCDALATRQRPVKRPGRIFACACTSRCYRHAK